MTKTKTTTRRTTEAAKPTQDTAAIHTAAPDAKAKQKPGRLVSAGAVNLPVAEKSVTAAPPEVTPPRQTKAALLRAQLSEPGGVSLAALIKATSWQAHTLRAALSGLRKEGLTVTRRREGEDTIYAIVASGSGETSTAGDAPAVGIKPAVTSHEVGGGATGGVSARAAAEQSV